MTAKLCAMPASHPSLAAALMLERKEIEYETAWLLLPFTCPILRLRGFSRRTVPALRIDGRKIQGSREISVAPDAHTPEPRLFPRDETLRRGVRQAERWGDEVLQPAARADRGLGAPSRPQDGGHPARRLPKHPGCAGSDQPAARGCHQWPNVGLVRPPIGATDEAVKADLTALPSMLDRVDGWIAAGVVGAEQPNAADFQIAPTLSLLMTVDELRPAIEARPSGPVARSLVPEYPGRSAGALPQQWLAEAGPNHPQAASEPWTRGGTP